MWKTLFICTVYFTSVFSTVCEVTMIMPILQRDRAPAVITACPKACSLLTTNIFPNISKNRYFSNAILHLSNVLILSFWSLHILWPSKIKNYPNKSLHTKRMGLRYQLGPPNNVKVKGSVSETRPWINYGPQRVVWRVKIHIGERK